MKIQTPLFDVSYPMPEGFLLYEDFISPAEEKSLLDILEGLDFSPIEIHGVVAKRTALHFGLRYDYATKELKQVEPIPEFLLPLRQKVAERFGISAERLSEVLINKYPPEAAIGWHRDAPVYDSIIGVSLSGGCLFKLRTVEKGQKGKRENFSTELPPRSVYSMKGAAAEEWEHSIPPTKMLRYSITFRTLKKNENPHQ